MSEWRFDIVHAKFFPLSMYRSGLKPKYSNTQFIQFSYIYIGKKINGYVAACSLESQDLFLFPFQTDSNMKLPDMMDGNVHKVREKGKKTNLHFTEFVPIWENYEHL